MNKEKIWCADGVSTNNTTRMSSTFVYADVEISVLNFSVDVKLIKYNTECHTLRGSWYIKATNLYIKYGCMKDSVLLGYDAVSMSNRLATFRGNVMSSTWSVETSRNVRRYSTLRAFMICTISCLEASESDHSVPRSHISEMHPPPHPLPNPLNSRGCMKVVYADDDSRITQTFQAQLVSNGTALACNRCRISTFTKLWNNCSCFSTQFMTTSSASTSKNSAQN